jgi:RNA recognition motif-containing protein
MSKANQIFVRNLSYQIDEAALTQAFEQYGPLKRVSIARETDGTNKGFGFVKFALEEDALKACESLQGHSLAGRNLKLEIAFRKGSDEEVKKRKELSDAAGAVVVSSSSFAKKPLSVAPEVQGQVPALPVTVPAARVANNSKPNQEVVVFGLPESVRASQLNDSIVKAGFKKTFAKLITQQSPLYEELALATVHPAGRAFLVTTSSKTDAAAVMDTLNGSTLASLGLDDAAPAERKKRRIKCCRLVDITDSRRRRRQCRLIIRNLAFQATEELVREQLDIFGPILEVEIPKVAVSLKGDEKDRLTPRGFGFVTYLCEKDAKLAVKSSLLEGDGVGVKKGVKVCNRFVAMDFCLAKDKYKPSESSTAEEVVETTEEDAAEVDDDNEDDSVQGSSQGASDDDEQEEDGDENNEDDDDKGDEPLEGDGKEEEDGIDAQLEKKSIFGNDVSEGCTVFVRCDTHHIAYLTLKFE